jgi:hypothetical protein
LKKWLLARAAVLGEATSHDCRRLTMKYLLAAALLALSATLAAGL